jgi:hypothetical protein
MHRVPWWNTWRCVGLLSMVVWGETGCIAVLSPQVRQQADRTLIRLPIWRGVWSPSPGVSWARARTTGRSATPCLCCYTCVEISLWPQATLNEVYPSLWL